MKQRQFEKHLRECPYLWWELNRWVSRDIPSPEDISYIAVRPWNTLGLDCQLFKYHNLPPYTSPLKKARITYTVIWDVAGEDFYRYLTLEETERFLSTVTSYKEQWAFEILFGTYGEQCFGKKPCQRFAEEFRKRFGPDARLVAVVRILWTEDWPKPYKPKRVDIYYRGSLPLS